MSEEIKHFDFSGYRLMILTSRTKLQCIESLMQGHCDGFYLSEAHGFDLDSIEFLGELSAIKALRIMHDIKIKHFNSIKKLINLEYLCTRAKRLALDLTTLTNLKNLQTDYMDERIALPSSLPKLEVLLLGHFNPTDKNLGSIAFAKSIKKLFIVQANLESLWGLEEFMELTEVHLSYLPILEDICTLNPPKLNHLEFYCCKKIKNFDELSKFKELEILEIVDSGTIPNLLFFNEMPKLRRFFFVKTNVLDGDLSPTLRLEYAYTLPKRHYSHKPEQLPGFPK